MILGVILCCVISVIEARTIKPVYIMGREQETNIQRIREQNDAYGAETIQLNGRSPRAPAWPQPNSDNGNMFLLPKVLNPGDQINITGIFTSNPPWISLSLITERDGFNGKEPDNKNIACQLFMSLDSNDGNGSIALKQIMDGNVKEDPINDVPADLIPDLYSNGKSKETLALKVVVSTNGFYQVEFYIGESYISKITLKHNSNDIRYLALEGGVDKVEKLEVLFA